jgi:hypothetical protein
MANKLNNLPMVIDTDITTWRNNATITAAGYTTGIRVKKVVLTVGPGGASAAGTVTIQAPSDSATLYPPMPVAASIAANSILITDEPPDETGTLTWRDFKVTGVTATGTILYLYWTV